MSKDEKQKSGLKSAILTSLSFLGGSFAAVGVVASLEEEAQAAPSAPIQGVRTQTFSFVRLGNPFVEYDRLIQGW